MTAFENPEPRELRPSINVMQLFLDDAGRYAVLTHDEQIAMAKRVEAGDTEAFTEWWCANCRLVVHWAKRYQGQGVDLPDLVEEGMFGLRRAMEKFDWRRDIHFSTYATWWIRQSLQRAVRGGGRLIRVPESVILEELEAVRAGTVPRPAPRIVASLDQAVGEDGGASFGDLLSNDERTPEEEVVTEVAIADLLRAIEALPARQRHVICMRWGINRDRPSAIQTIARELGIGVRKVKDLEASAMRELERTMVHPRGERLRDVS